MSVLYFYLLLNSLNMYCSRCCPFSSLFYNTWSWLSHHGLIHSSNNCSNSCCFFTVLSYLNQSHQKTFLCVLHTLKRSTRQIHRKNFAIKQRFAAGISQQQLHPSLYAQPLRFSSSESTHRAKTMFFPKIDFTSLAPVATSPAVAPLKVTCSWTPYLPSHLSSVLIWVALVDNLVSFTWASVVALYPSCFQGGRTSAPAVVTTCVLRIGDGDFTGLIGEVEILPAGETDLMTRCSINVV